MLQLPRSLQAWPGEDFATTVKAELKALPAGSLPLAHGLNEGGIVDDSDLEISVLKVQAAGDGITAKLACFFTEVVGGCNCHDDPHTRHAYCEVQACIDLASGVVRFTPLAEFS